jgi:hypothetical protein
MLPGKNMKLTCLEFSVLIGLTIVLTGCGGGNTSAPPQPSTPLQPQTLSTLVDSLANSAMKQQGIPGMTVALAKNGIMLYGQAHGDPIWPCTRHHRRALILRSAQLPSSSQPH